MIADKPIALVDLDGIILEHDQEDGDGFDPKHFGPVKESARWGLKTLRNMGYKVVIWTTRGNSPTIMGYLAENGIYYQKHYDAINYHSHQPKGASDKLYADLMIDDRALKCPTDWKDIIKEVTFRDGAEKNFSSGKISQNLESDEEGSGDGE